MYIISALMMSAVIALFVGAGLKLSVGNLKANNGRDQRALLAAESGLRYVQSRTAANYGWMADEGLVINDPDLVVEENRGNIIGLVRAPDGQFAQFRIRFNYQDDSEGDADGRSDPSTSFQIDSPYVSVNNLLGGSAVPVPRADGPGSSVTASSPTPYEVPGGTVCVIVEGRFGPGLSNLSASNMNPQISGPVTTRIIEANLDAAQTPGVDAAAMSAGDMTFELDGNVAVTLSAKDKNQASRLRSRSKIVVQDGGSPNLKSKNGETYTSDGTLQADAESGIKTQTEDTSTSFYRLEWGDVKKADPTGQSISAGTYVVWDDGTLHYYDMDYNSYVTFIEANPTSAGTIVDSSSLPSGFQFDGSNASKPKFEISGDIHVQATANNNELNIIPRKGAQEDPPDASGSQTESQMVSSVLSGLSSPDQTGAGAGIYSGPEAARWNIPISGPIPGGEIRAETGNLSYGTWQGVILKETSPGQAALIVDSHSLPLFSPSVGSNPLGALTNGMSSTFSGTPQLQQILSMILGSGSEMRELNLGSAPAALRADNLKVEFTPPDGQSAILSADGNVRIGANVKGDGGSITSAETIRLVGNGTDLQASIEDGLTLYAKEDVVMSTLKEKNVGSNNWEYKDLKLKGVVYAWGDIEAKLDFNDPSVQKSGKFKLEGTMVAYGGDPSGQPGAGSGGAIDVRAGDTEIKYNPAYLLKLDNSPPPGPVKQSLYTVY